MRFIRFFLIFLAFSFVLAACGSSDDDVETDNGNNAGNNNGNENNGNEDENQQNVNCGNSAIDEGEICDGGAKECKEINSGYTGGFASCKDDCSGWNTASCSGSADNGGNGDGGNGDGGNNGGNGGNGDGGNGGNGGNTSEGGIWVDPATYLIWENPLGNQGTGGTGISHSQAVTYCDNLVLKGYDDWRVPTIDELRTLVRGVSTTMTGGKCPTSEGCQAQDSCNKDKENKQGFGNSCLGCVALDTTTYDPAISYLDFENDCQLTDRNLENGQYYIVPEMYADYYRLWSSTKNTGLVGSVAQAFWYLNYSNGQINSGSDAMSTTHWVRCVRTGTAADVPEHQDEVEYDPSWECIADTECGEGKWCEKNKCVGKPSETYTASNGLEWQAGTIDETLNKWVSDVVRIQGWDAAKEYCEKLTYAGHDDWRLPNITELKSLVKGCDKTNQCAVTAETPGYNDSYLSTKAACQGCGSGNYLPSELGQQTVYPYWSSTTDDPDKGTRVWSVDFKTAEVVYDYATQNLYARCVRGSMN